MLRVVDYCRVSTEEERQTQALKTQIQENAEFIKSKPDWVHVDTYIDEGRSAKTTKHRDEFLRLLDDISQDKFDIILIKQIDRGWRKHKDWKSFEEEIYFNKKKLYIRLKNEFYDFENDSIYLSTNMEAMFAEWHSRNLSRKMNNAHKTRMAKGTVVTNGKIWGYNQKNAKLEINEEQASIIRMIFNEYIDGNGFRKIAEKLNDMGIKNQNGKSFSMTTLKRIIRQEKYKGTLICGKRHKNFFTDKYDSVPEGEWKIHENAVPAIVTKEVWEQANQILKQKSKPFNESVYGYFQGSYALSGKVFCGKCNKVYYHGKYTTMKHAVWECQGYREHGKKENGCDNIRVPENELDEIVRTTIYDFGENKNSYIDDIMRVLELSLDEDNQSVIEKIEIDIEKAKNKKAKLFDLYFDETITKDEYREKNEEINADLEGLNKQLSEQMGIKERVEDKRQRLLEIKKSLDEDIQSASFISDDVIKKLIEKVIVNSDKSIEIYMNTGFYEKYNKEDKKYVKVTSSRQDGYTY